MIISALGREETQGRNSVHKFVRSAAPGPVHMAPVWDTNQQIRRRTTVVIHRRSLHEHMCHPSESLICSIYLRQPPSTCWNISTHSLIMLSSTAISGMYDHLIISSAYVRGNSVPSVPALRVQRICIYDLISQPFLLSY
jgi:hypothetical protein